MEIQLILIFYLISINLAKLFLLVILIILGAYNSISGIYIPVDY